jgi:hypothetical protein
MLDNVRYVNVGTDRSRSRWMRMRELLDAVDVVVAQRHGLHLQAPAALIADCSTPVAIDEQVARHAVCPRQRCAFAIIESGRGSRGIELCVRQAVAVSRRREQHLIIKRESRRISTSSGVTAPPRMFRKPTFTGHRQAVSPGRKS